jgi:DivIVA domain-containing protein
MEMSPKAIAAVTFPVVRKGYDPEQVRSFLSQLSRGVEELQNRALQAEAKSRLTTAAPAAPAGAEGANIDSITKTLVLAQRTADATLAEARQEADGIRRQASERADGILAEARAQATQITSAAEEEATRSGDAARARVQAEVEALEARRQALLAHSDALQQHVTSQRDRLASTVSVLQRALDDPDGLQDVPRPEGPETNASAFSSGEPVFADDPGGPATSAVPIGTTPGTGETPPAPPQGAPPLPAPGGVTADPSTQEVPPVGERDVNAWPSFFDTGPAGDDRWK